MISFDGTAYPGSSGSPLFDPDTGDVIGVPAPIKSGRRSIAR
jgi:V8-like Glu-specific endopeptidase